MKTKVNNVYPLKKVINASGKMTILGVSKVSSTVLEAQKYGNEHFFEMSELMKGTGAYIAQRIGAEAATIVSSASAGIAQSVAAVIGNGSLYHLHHPYSPEIKKREIIIPKGHNIDYGAPIEIMIEQGGGQIVEAGYANMCTVEHIEEMISEHTAAIFYVKSHHAVQKSILNIEAAINVATRYEIPIIIDAAAEEDIQDYAKLSADLVIFSGAKALEGPSSGLVFGKKEAIENVRMQAKGLGRSMKIGKENIWGLTQAIDQYLEKTAKNGAAMQKRIQPFIEVLNNMEMYEASIVKDSAGRDIYRAAVKVLPPLNAIEVVKLLKQQNPAIYTREYQTNNGIVEFDVRAVNDEELKEIQRALKNIEERCDKNE